MKEEDVRSKLESWWYDQARMEIERLAPKAVEYGASDLKIMGQALMLMVPEKMDEADGVEMAIAFYALGKIARVFGALERGVMPSEDTWQDLAVYARMALYVRENGSWP